MNKAIRLADVFQATVAFGIGGICALELHARWYSGGWMDWFGDSPSSNPAYERLAKWFVMMPHVAGGAVVGTISGFGYFEATRVLVRFCAVMALFLFALLSNEKLAVMGFLPSATLSFCLSAGISLVYFRLSLSDQKMPGKTEET